MTAQTRATLKTYFETGDKPTQTQFANTIDSFVSLLDTTAQTVVSDISLGGSLAVSGKSTLASVVATIVSATTVSPGSITGTATNDNAPAGAVGEYFEIEVSAGAAISLSNGQTNNAAKLPLGAGDWDVWANAGFLGTGSTTTTQFIAGLNTVSSALPTAPGKGGYFKTSFAGGAGTADHVFQVGMIRVPVAVSANVYLGVQGTFAASTLKGYGFIGARRRR